MEILELKNTIAEMKKITNRSQQQSLSGRKKISELEDRQINMQYEEQREERMKKEGNNLKKMWDIIKSTNMYVLEYQKERREEKEQEKYWKK